MSIAALCIHMFIQPSWVVNLITVVMFLFVFAFGPRSVPGANKLEQELELLGGASESSILVVTCAVSLGMCS